MLGELMRHISGYTVSFLELRSNLNAHTFFSIRCSLGATVIKVTTGPNNPNLKIGDKIELLPSEVDSNCWHVRGIQRGDLNLTHVTSLYTDTTKKEATRIFEEYKAM